MGYLYTPLEESLYYMMENLLLSATELVRMALRKRFKIETGVDWLNDEASLEKFANGPGRRAYSKCRYFQKSVMTSKPLETWDISVLATVMENFGDEEKYGNENHAVLNLRKMRYELALFTVKKISTIDYDQKMKELEKSLRSLGKSANGICKFVVDSLEASPLESFKAVRAMLLNADQLLQDGEEEEVATCYNEAVDVPNLMPNTMAMVLEKRAEFQLSLVKDPVLDGSKIDQAFDDAKKALDLNEISWKGHHLIAKCFKLRDNVVDAILHLERSLAISPGQKEVEEELDSCEIPTDDEDTSDDEIVSRMMALSVSKEVEDLEARIGIKMSEEEVLDAAFGSTKESSVLSRSPSYNEDYMRGLQCLLGHGIPPNAIEAVKYFQKAASTRHPEAMAQLGLCYYNGYGTDKNIQEAMRINRVAAEMDPKTPGTGAPTQMNCNEGVASAQHFLGLAFETGQGLKTANIQEAMKWYRRAMENGSGDAALNLGNLYSRGIGVSASFKMAELCWREAVNFKSAPAAILLAESYIGSVEPERATHYFKLARQIGCEEALKMSEEDFNRRVREVEETRRQFELIVLKTNEKRDKLDTKGLTFCERANRVFPGCFPDCITESPNVSGSQGSVLARKPYLNTPTRKNAFKFHRESFKELKIVEQFIHQPGIATDSSVPNLEKTVRRKMSLAKPIYVYEMSPVGENLYENRVLHLTVIDEPNYISTGIFVLTEDDDGDVIRLLVCNLKNNKENLAKFSPGCRFRLLNPLMKLTLPSEIHYLRNDEPKYIHHLPKVKQMCRFCGVENAGCHCSKCKRPYCSKECQNLDWKMMNHKLICSIKPL